MPRAENTERKNTWRYCREVYMSRILIHGSVTGARASIVPARESAGAFVSPGSALRANLIVQAMSGGRSVDLARQIVSAMPTTPLTAGGGHRAAAPPRS